jgi:hypothetical protein
MRARIARSGMKSRVTVNGSDVLSCRAWNRNSSSSKFLAPAALSRSGPLQSQCAAATTQCLWSQQRSCRTADSRSAVLCANEYQCCLALSVPWRDSPNWDKYFCGVHARPPGLLVARSQRMIAGPSFSLQPPCTTIRYGATQNVKRLENRRIFGYILPSAKPLLYPDQKTLTCSLNYSQPSVKPGAAA